VSWEEELDEALEQAREDLGYPTIKHWEKKQGIGTAAVDMNAVRRKVMVDPKFAPQLSSLAKKGLMSHEIGHSKKHPKDARTAILENHWGEEYNNSDKIVNFFDDLVDNISLIMQGRDSQAEELEALYREISDNQHMVEDVIRRRYEEVSDIRHGTEGQFDYGSTINEPEGDQKELFHVLQSIDFRQDQIIDDHEFYFHKFASAFDPYLDDMQQQDIGGDVGPENFSEEEIEDAIDEIARGEHLDEDQEIDPEELEEIIDSLGEKGDKINQKPDNATTTFYDSLACQYNLEIEGKAANRVGTAPNGHKDWRPGDRTEMIDPENSLGKVGMLGITKTRKMEGYKMHGGRAEGKPDATMVLDSSKSMQDPEKQKSYAVLGAFCAANSYLDSGSEVAVANFSNRTEITDFTKDKSKVQNALVDYQNGGTNLNVDAIQELESQKSEDTHSILITDAGIQNFDETTEYLENSQGKNTVLWINDEYNELPEKYSELAEAPETSLHHIQDESDIPEVVLGEVN
jgi:hypothetical protein